MVPRLELLSVAIALALLAYLGLHDHQVPHCVVLPLLNRCARAHDQLDSYPNRAR